MIVERTVQIDEELSPSSFLGDVLGDMLLIPRQIGFLFGYIHIHRPELGIL